MEKKTEKNPSSNGPSSGNNHYFAVFMGNTHIKSLDGLDEVDGFDEIWNIKDMAINLIVNPLGLNERGKKEMLSQTASNLAL